MRNEHGDKIERDLNDYTAPITRCATPKSVFNYAGYCAYYFKQDNPRIAQVGGRMEQIA